MTGSPGIGDLLPPWNMSLGMNLRSTKLLFLTPVRFTAVVFIPLLVSAQDGARVQMTATSSAKTSEVIPLMVAAQDKTLHAPNDKAYPSQVSGTVVDVSGAVIAGATVQVRSASG